MHASHAAAARHALSLVPLLLLAAAAGSGAPPSSQPPTLRPYAQLTGQLIELDTGARSYRLAGLRPRTSYEVRVSFPASIPATFRFELADGAAAAAAVEAAQAGGATGRRRRLLDCEKLLFQTDAHGGAQGFAEPHVVVRALRRSVHRDGPKAGAPQLVYNIVLAEVVLGLLPRDALPVIACIVLTVVAAGVWALYFSERVFPHLLAALVCDGAACRVDGHAGGASTAAGPPRPAPAAGRAGGKRRS